jgi:branched-chain amino acid transport system ATP-binding protein
MLTSACVGPPRWHLQGLPMAEPLLRLTSVSKRFGKVVIADGLALTVAAGEAVGIIGPNGAGKSSVFGLIAGDLRTDGGRIDLSGKDISDLSPSKRCRLGIGRTFQIPQPFARMTVAENVAVATAFGPDFAPSQRRDSSADVLALTGLDRHAEVMAGALPLLSRKRLELARALATDPKVLLLDEIAGGLTDVECEELVELIQALHRRGIAILWIEHVLRALTPVVDRILVLNSGAWIAEGRAEMVLNHPEVRRIYMGSVE